MKPLHIAIPGVRPIESEHEEFERRLSEILGFPGGISRESILNRVQAMVRAIHRDSDQYERRAVYDGKGYIDRHDGGFIDRSRRRENKGR